MSYTQKMRSWPLTILGAILAVLLWKAAQMVGREHFSGDMDSFTAEYKDLTEKLKAAGKQLERDETTEIDKAVISANFSKARDLINTYRKKYLPPDTEVKETKPAEKPEPTPSAEDERLGKLEELVTDARKRLSALEGDMGEKKKIAESLQQRVDALKMIPPPTPSINDA